MKQTVPPVPSVGKSQPQAPGPVPGNGNGSKIHARWARSYTEQMRFALVPVRPGTKKPIGEQWNQPGHYFTDPGPASAHWTAHPDHGMAILHGPSSTGSLDVDHLEHTRVALSAIGIELDPLFESLCIESGSGSKKPFFRLPAGTSLERRFLSWPTQDNPKKPLCIFELRGGLVLDCLPPTVHPSGKPYRWLPQSPTYDTIPLIPSVLLKLWQEWDKHIEAMRSACPWWKPKAKQPKPKGTSNADWDALVSSIRAAVSCSELLPRIGATHVKDRSWLCPFHPEKTPSFWTFTDKDGCELWHDSHGSAPVGGDAASGASVGDVIDLYRHLKQIELRGAATAALAKELGLSLPGQKSKASTPRTTPRSQRPPPPMPPAPQGDWTDLLLWSGAARNPSLRKNESNIVTVLTHHPDWDGVIKYDEFAKKIMAHRRPPSHSARLDPPSWPRMWTDTDDAMLAVWLQRTTLRPQDWRDSTLDVSPLTSVAGVNMVARMNAYHPVKRYLQGLKWDQTPRINTWLARHFGAITSDPTYLEQVSSMWLIQAVARILEPGAQSDSTLILEGDQGLKKTTALRILGGEWFTSQLADMGTKDADLQLQGVWIVELAELDGITGKAEVSRVKQFLTRTVDRFRVPFGRRVEDFPRQCVFGATANPSAYLKDETGNRRFWPVLCTRKLNDLQLHAERDQLWAEAMHRFTAGERWWLSDEMEKVAAVEQDARLQHDAWEELVQDYVSRKERVSIGQILHHAIGIHKDKWTQPDQNRIGRCLRRLGWVKTQVRVNSTDIDLRDAPGFDSGRVKLFIPPQRPGTAKNDENAQLYDAKRN